MEIFVYGLISLSEIQGKASSQFLGEEGRFNFHFRFHSWSLPDGYGYRTDLVNCLKRSQEP